MTERRPEIRPANTQPPSKKITIPQTDFTSTQDLANAPSGTSAIKTYGCRCSSERIDLSCIPQDGLFQDTGGFNPTADITLWD